MVTSVIAAPAAVPVDDDEGDVVITVEEARARIEMLSQRKFKRPAREVFDMINRGELAALDLPMEADEMLMLRAMLQIAGEAG